MQKPPKDNMADAMPPPIGMRDIELSPEAAERINQIVDDTSIIGARGKPMASFTTPSKTGLDVIEV